MRWLNKQEIIIRNRHFSESIEVTRQNTATHPPYYVIKGNQRQTTVNMQRQPKLHPDQHLLFPQQVQPRSVAMAITTSTVRCFSLHIYLNNEMKIGQENKEKFGHGKKYNCIKYMELKFGSLSPADLTSPCE